MATVIFYEKPGCVNNTKQKTLLKAAGHTVNARNLLTEAWTADRLQQFFGQLPVVEWFNRTAPLIKSGEVIPDRLDCTTHARASAVDSATVNPKWRSLRSRICDRGN
jgi:nitrogenase-associated protein